MNQTLYTPTSDRRTTPRLPPLSQPLALLALLLCAASPVASEQLTVVSDSAHQSDITEGYTTVFGETNLTPDNSLEIMDDSELGSVNGRYDKHTKLNGSASFAVILWDEIKTNKKNYNQYSNSTNNHQRNTVTYSHQ